MKHEITQVMNPIVSELRKRGYYAAHLSPPNEFGFPDIIAFNKSAPIFIECKDMTGISPTTKVINEFTKYQIPWILNNYKKANNIFIFYKYGKTFYVYKITDEKSISDILHENMLFFLNMSADFPTLPAAAEFILSNSAT